MTSRDQNHSPARSFLAGSVSGVTKLLVGHPFDTVKVRIQTGIYNSPWACLKGTIINEGMRGLYKGATPPLIGWAFMDSLMLGSLHNYKAAMRYQMNTDNLPVWAVGICGMGAGWTVSSIASPVEHIKVNLSLPLSKY
ncbi:Mitochondrial substrate carrier family protein L [Neolecta irregularis DAH-3]|uniref:Mitochondrial substrate carrier family protein L n=1 Tax=Neolecta irregularis (strain DAH-3) TaxID=1198029 RepID=A0A1U7LPB3_NEOID|nr:Mitochondrial substrate carrier family protein L [Neolecta irregularis DAH-3]|eukprot:OLL24506.1 Mitochondrial substrate carrier family protein L [Neolecta irregularis DAH-3]